MRFVILDHVLRPRLLLNRVMHGYAREGVLYSAFDYPKPFLIIVKYSFAFMQRMMRRASMSE